MDSESDSDCEYEVLLNVVITRRQRVIRDRPKLFSFFDDKDFRDRFRMCKQAAWTVLQLIRDQIKHKTAWNEALSPEEMLLLTLRFYATGCMQQTGADLCGVSKSTASRVIGKVSHQIALLREQFVCFPSTVEEQKQVQKDFYLVAKFPKVVAAMDCTHVKIISPGGGDAELYRNRKGFFSFNVQTLCDRNLKILDIVARWPGSTHDATILRNSRICSRFEAGEFNNLFVVADSGYPCNTWIMTPLLRTSTPAENLYNESQIRTRNCVERSYGVWKRRFPALSLGIRMNVRKVESVIVAAAVLHNICCLNNEREAPTVSQDIQNSISFVLNVPSAAFSEGNSAHNNRRNLINNHFATL